MATVVENGLNIAVSGLATYIALSWMQETAVMVYAKLALMLPTM